MSQTQDEINHGQQRIISELVQIDRKVLEALKAVIDILKTVGEGSATASKIAQIDLNSLEAAISRAHSVNVRVSDIIPPGASEQNSQSFLEVARSLNLDGPPDWSSRVDDYLSGADERVHE